MTEFSMMQVVFYLLIILIFVKPLGWYMAQVFEGNPCGLDKVVAPLERMTYKLCGIRPEHEMNWIEYLSTMLIFNLLCVLGIYLLQRMQFFLPLNPQQFTGVPAYLALNTASSFVTNTNWQAYAGETTLSYFTQMSGLTVQNFISAATGMAVLVALIRSFSRHETEELGNYWVDMVRGTYYILLPLAFVLAVSLISQGVIQNFKPYQKAHLTQAYTDQTRTVTEQVLPMGPVASQIAIKQLGTNGGGFFNTNSAHPFENPTPLSNWLEMLALLLIPAAFCYTFGCMVKDKSQGYALLIAMTIIFVPLIMVSVCAEQHGNPVFTHLGVDQDFKDKLSSGGNMEGKEVRFGITDSALWATATTATSNGSVNSMHDSYTPLGSLPQLWLMHLGEVIFGGLGSGLYGMLMVVILAVFAAGLMVGRTPEYLGKKIEPFEMKMASIAVLIMPITVLICAALALVIPAGIQSILNPGAHGFTEVLYAFTSMTNNNGSAFAGLNANTNFYNLLGSFCILLGRYWIAIPVLALAGSIVKKKIVPSSSGTLPTDTPLFIFLLISVILILGALTFFPALALGPIVEHFMLWSKYGS